MVPVQLTHLTGITNGMDNDTAHTSLRAQVQPFQTYTPQQIQEQLQHLHIQQHKESEVMMHTAAPGVCALLQQHPQHQKPLLGVDTQSMQAVRETSPTKDSNSSVLHHLLSQSPKPVAPNSGVQSNPFSRHQSRRASFPENVPRTAPLLASQLRQKHPDAVPPSELYAMVGNVASRLNHELPSFPVNIETREGSPTKGLGQRSPTHDHQMASIAEDTREETTGLSARSSRLALNMLPNGMDIQREVGYSTIPGVLNRTRSLQHSKQQELLSQMPASNGTHFSFGYPVQQNSNHAHMPVIPTTLSPIPNSHSILNRISTVLSSNGIQHYQSNGGFLVEHDGVKLHILCNQSHLNTVHMQFIAGDPLQYQTLSSQLATQLQFTE